MVLPPVLAVLSAVGELVLWDGHPDVCPLLHTMVEDGTALYVTGEVMAGKTWLVLDVNNLAHRAYHSTGDLSFEDKPTGVVYGILCEINRLQEEFQTHRLAFAFDRGPLLRVKQYPWYKETRRAKYNEMDEDEKAGIDGMRDQVEKLRTDYLDGLGYPNVFFQKGYEADDVLAMVAHTAHPDDRTILVSGDRDLYQCLRKRVSVYHPPVGKTRGRLVTRKQFREEWGLEPQQWVFVKAIAGDATDDVPGVDGVGLKTAAKYLRGELTAGEKLKDIKRFVNSPQYPRNVGLIQLPFPGCKEFKAADHDPPARRAWQALTEKLGMSSLAEAIPGDGGKGWRAESVKGK